MNISGIKIGKKGFVIIGIVVLILLISFISSKIKANKEQEEFEEKERIRQEELQKSLENLDVNPSVDISDYDFDAELQTQLVKKYGKPPEGFEWDMMGNLIALSDDNSTPDNVMFYFVRSLSILDFSTAQRYSKDSKVIADYQDYYSAIEDVMTDYYKNFLRKQYKLSMTSLEVLGVEDTAVFANGAEYITIRIKSLDLTDKDFWIKDKDKLFNDMYIFRETETDDVKARQYLYDYILDKYKDGTIGKKEYTIELKLEKNSGVSTNSNGWLVTGDGELSAILQYENGVDVAEYILSQFNDWVMQKQLNEMQNKTPD